MGLKVDGPACLPIHVRPILTPSGFLADWLTDLLQLEPEERLGWLRSYLTGVFEYIIGVDRSKSSKD